VAVHNVKGLVQIFA